MDIGQILEASDLGAVAVLFYITLRLMADNRRLSDARAEDTGRVVEGLTKLLGAVDNTNSAIERLHNRGR